MSRRLNLLGQNIGKWHVLQLAEVPKTRKTKGKTFWLCRCACGTERVIPGSRLNTWTSLSCGCSQRETAARVMRATSTKHGYTKYPEYGAYCGMIHRCHNEADNRFSDYGGRGITVCERWKNSFLAFLEDMGRRPSPDSTIEREDFNKGYSPDNCRWAPRSIQNTNTRRNVKIQAFGKEQNLADWARESGVSQGTIHARITKLGWDAERAISTPARKMATSKVGIIQPKGEKKMYCDVNITTVEAVANALKFLESLGYTAGGDIHDDLAKALTQLRQSQTDAAMMEQARRHFGWK